MMDLNMAFHEKAGKQVFNINQVGLKNIPLRHVIRERVRATERFWLAFWPPLLSFKGAPGRTLPGSRCFDGCALVLG